MDANADDIPTTSNAASCLRERTRHDITAYREVNRHVHVDAARAKICPSKVIEVVNLMKSKRSKKAHLESLYYLSQAFEQSSDNTEAFLGVPGSMDMLVSKLSDVRESQQIHAAECLCNMTQSGPKACDKIVRMAGCYLCVYLDSEVLPLKRYSLWCLANIIRVFTEPPAEGKRKRCGGSVKVLMDMNIVMALWQLYTAHETEPVDAEHDFSKEAGMALQRLVMSDGIKLRPQDREFLTKHMRKTTQFARHDEYYLCVVSHAGIIESLGEAEVRHLIAFALSRLNIATKTVPFNLVYAVVVLTKLLQHFGAPAAVVLREGTHQLHTQIVPLLTKALERNLEPVRRAVLMLTAQIILIPQNESPFVGDEFMEVWRFHKWLTTCP